MSRVRAIGIAVLLNFVSCASDDASGMQDADRSAQLPNAFAQESVWFSGTVDDLLGAGPLQGVEVCDDGSGRCVETDDDGRFFLYGLMPDTEVVLSYRLEGYRPMLHALVTPRLSTQLRWSIVMTSLADEGKRAEDIRNQLHDADRPELDLSMESRDSTAQIQFGAASEVDYALTADVHIVLDPPSGDGPFYNVFPTFDLALELPSEETALMALMVNVEPRDEGYELVYTRDTGSECTYYGGGHGAWPSRSGRTNAVRVPVRAGFTTSYAQAFCGSQ